MKKWSKRVFLCVAVSLFLLSSFSLPTFASYRALELNGSGYASIADGSQSGLDMGLSDFMIGMRIKLLVPLASQPEAFPRVVDKWVSSYIGYSVYFRRSDGELSLIVDDGNLRADMKTSASQMDDLQWHYLVVIVDRSSATGMKFYIDGNEVGSYTQQDNPTSLGNIDSANSFGVGASGDGTAMLNALLDELRAWNFGLNGLPADYETYITWRAAGRNVFKDISEYDSGSWNGYADADRTEKITDPGIESWTGDAPDDWTESGESAGVRDITDEQVEIHGGSHAVKLEVTNNDGSTDFEIRESGLSLTALKYYEFKAWYYYPTRTAGTITALIYNDVGGQVSGTTYGATNAEYEQYLDVFSLLSINNPRVILRMKDETTTGIVYFDDISVKRVGLVAHYKFNGDYSDETTNSNDLSAGGTGNVFPGYTLKKQKIVGSGIIK